MRFRFFVILIRDLNFSTLAKAIFLIPLLVCILHNILDCKDLQQIKNSKNTAKPLLDYHWYLSRNLYFHFQGYFKFLWFIFSSWDGLHGLNFLWSCIFDWWQLLGTNFWKLWHNTSKTMNLNFMPNERLI